MKHPTSQTVLKLLFAVTVITWASCHEPEKPHPYPCRLEGIPKHVIPDSTAAKYQRRFLAAYDTLKKIAPDTFLARHFRIPNAETFSKDIICALIHSRDVDSVRIFYGEDTTGGFRLILKGVDKKGNIVRIKFPTGKTPVSDTIKSPSNVPQDDGDAVENGQTCPPCMVDGPGK